MTLLRFKDLLINFTTEFDQCWSDWGSGADESFTVWRPSTSSDALKHFSSLGDVAVGSHRNINQQRIVAVVSDANQMDGTALRPPDDYQLVWKDSGSGAAANGSIWRPVPPPGYVAMGHMCGMQHEKPSRNAMRCVRADLVIASTTGDRIWADHGSGADKDFSAWTISAPHAEPGEINLAPGTFVAHASHGKPPEHTPTYSLRLQLTAPVISPAPPPALSAYEQPSLRQPSHASTVCELPWFCVRDPVLGATLQLQDSPHYQVQRTDTYVLAGFGHNPSAASKPFTWTATKGADRSATQTLKSTSSVELFTQWPTHPNLFMMNFSAQFDTDFTHTQHSVNAWLTRSPLEIITYIPAHKAVAGYLIQSEYKVLRQDGSQLANAVIFTNGDQVHMSEFPAHEPEPNPAIVNEPPAAVSPEADNDLEIVIDDFIDHPLSP